MVTIVIIIFAIMFQNHFHDHQLSLSEPSRVICLSHVIFCEAFLHKFVM